jgi:hypothetical protein
MKTTTVTIDESGLKTASLFRERQEYRFNKEADQYLTDLYDSVGAKTWNQKYNLLTLILGRCNFSHDPTDEQKTRAMEYEILDRGGLLELVLV